MRITLFILISFFTSFIYAQSGNIDGQVVTKNGSGIDLATLALYDNADNLIKSEYSDEDGSFSFTNVEFGTYKIVVNFLGFKERSIDVDLTEDGVSPSLSRIVLEEDNQILDEVVIKGKTPFIERKIDRTVVNPDALISNAGKNALEVLETAPGVMVDSNGNLMLKGRSGVTVFINDKPSYLSGTELESYLRSLPAGSIKRIEIMTNPPAEYDAAGNSGVINIIIKRNTLKGLYGNASFGFRQGMFSNSNNSLNLNYNKGKLSFYTNIYAGFWTVYQDLNINRYYRTIDDVRTSSFAQNSLNQRDGKYLNSKIGVDFYVSENTTIGMSFKGNTNPMQRSTDNIAFVRAADETLMQRVVADNIDDRSFTNGLANFYVSHDLDSLGSKISFDADYVQYDSENVQDFQNFIFTPNDLLTYQDVVNGQIPSSIKIWAGKTDYVKMFGNGAKLGLGLKSARTQTDNEAIYSTTVENVTTPNYDLSNRFLYDERINAAYINMTSRIGKVDVQAGLRGEATKLTGEQLGNIERPDTNFTRTYNTLFPTFYASTNLDSAGIHNLSFSYGRRINRPYFQDLNPFISPLDRFTFYSGNPDLLPTFSHNISLTHSYKGMLTSSFNFSKTVDGINETLEIIDEIYYSRPGNIASSETYTLSTNLAKPINSWYNLNAYTEIGHMRFESPLYTEQLKSSGTYWFLLANNSFTIGRGWRMDVGGRYITDLVSAQFLIKSYGMLNMGFQKGILDGKGTLKIGLNDILYTRRGSGVINNLRLTDADWNSKYDTRNIALTLSLRFGKSTSKKQRYNSSGSDEEQSRVKS